MTDRRPRVLYCINGFDRGGAEKGLLELVRGGAFSDSEIRIVSIIRGAGAYIGDLEKEGTVVRPLADKARMSSVDWLKSIPRFAVEMRSFKPDLVVLSLPQANIAGRLASILWPKAVVASFEHNTHLAKPIYETLFRLTSGLVDWSLADCGQTLKEASQRLYRRQAGTAFVLPLVHFPASGSAPRKADGARAIKLLNAGRFTPVKNQQAIVEAVALLRTRGIAAEATLCGEGPLLADCQRLAAERGVADAVTFPGYAPDWVGTPADLFVLASRHEGLCIVALEAMAAGLPVVSPRVGGLVEYGPDAGVAFVDRADGVALADAIEALVEDPARRERMSELGIRTVETRFSRDAILAAYRVFSGEISALLRH